MRLLYWHPLFGRLRRWVAAALPAAQAPLFLGLIDGAAIQGGGIDAAGRDLGTIDAKLALGAIDATAVRLGHVPVRPGA